MHRQYSEEGMARNEERARGPRAVVTGASSGIGEAFARRLAHDGYQVVAHGRRRQRLETLAAELREGHGAEVDVLIADLSQDDDLHRMEAFLAARPVDLLVNNAGLTHLAPFHELEVATIEEMIRVHVLALTRLTHAVLPGMMERGQGAIINVSSDGVFVTDPAPVMVTYAATKAYVNTFTRALHRLAGGCGVRVQALCPGFVTSEILERHGLTFADWGIPEDVVMSAEDQVACSLAGLELAEIVCVPTLDDPSLLDRLAEIEAVIREHSSGTGVPADRYRATLPGR
jgi:short-subunit dehydrogenase